MTKHTTEGLAARTACSLRLNHGQFVYTRALDRTDLGQFLIVLTIDDKGFLIDITHLLIALDVGKEYRQNQLYVRGKGFCHGQHAVERLAQITGLNLKHVKL